MNIKQNSIVIEDSFKNYEKIQSLHLKILRSNSVPDLELMTIEREKLFLILKNSLDDMMENAGLNHGTDCVDELGKYENRLNLIMKLDDEISIEIKKYQKELKGHLNRMKKGKDAMNGYKNAGGSTSKPYVLSMNR